ncbi:MAG: glutamate racemase [Rhodomicrobium sp.]|nr:glutamate racemase [Rhodomicrobium sp.]
MSILARTPRLLFLDSGLGGLTVLRAARQAIPEAHIRFIADDAGFPYGLKTESVLIARLVSLIEKAVADFIPDCIVLACNTASTIALQVLRDTFTVPIVGTVPAIKPAAALTKSGLVSVLATPGTAGREYTRALIEKFGAGARFTLVGAPALAGIAEAYASGAAVDDTAIGQEIAPCFIESGSARTDVVVLGCTHYPLLLDRLDALAPWPIIWLDPAPAIARRIANVLAEADHIVGVGAKRGSGEIQFTSGGSPSPVLLALLQSYQLSTLPFEAAFAA